MSVEVEKAFYHTEDVFLFIKPSGKILSRTITQSFIYFGYFNNLYHLLRLCSFECHAVV